MEYHDLMNFWHDNLNIEIYKLDYEHLVENPMTEIKKRSSFRSYLKEKYLMPHENARSVKTASQQQVDKKFIKEALNPGFDIKSFC